MAELLNILLQVNIVGSRCILAAILLRMLLSRTSKIYASILWAVVFARMLIPVAAATKTSVSVQTLVLGNTLSGRAADRVLSVMWLAGIGVLAVYHMTASHRLHRQLKKSELVAENIYVTYGTDIPLVAGFANPGIYLPATLTEGEVDYIILHQQIHVNRKDSLIRLVFLCICILHWFNPLIWVAFFLAGRDMELACDELVLAKEGDNIRKEYAASLDSLTGNTTGPDGKRYAVTDFSSRTRRRNILQQRKYSNAFPVSAVALVIITAGFILFG